MNLFRTLCGLALTGLATTSSCISPPDYSLVPEIDFKEVEVTHVPASGGLLATDTLNFKLNFRDGDGDLGLTKEDADKAPYNATTGGPNNRGYQYNYIIQPFVKDNSGRFVLFLNPGARPGEYDSRYPRLDGINTKPAPLKGVLSYKLPIPIGGPVLRNGTVVRFEISILDRALQQSNKITTSEITLGL